jgi:hypothetical protein
MNNLELDQARAESEESHDVTARDQLWLLLLAVIPFTAATVWYVLS